MRGRVVSVMVEPNAGPDSIGDASGATIARRLIELGFVAGEPVEIIGEVRPGGDPIAVRIGASTFALRRREAQAVMVRLDA
jgi:ferrous iron transport protein A